MSHYHESLRERTMNNETLAGSENLIKPKPRMDEASIEKDFSGGANPYHNGRGGHQHLDKDHDSDTALRKIRTAGSISITPELFEKLYLSPKNEVHGDLRTTFGNPTPLALIGFLLSFTPLSMDLMGWRGAGGNGAAGTGTYYFFGGLLMMLGSLGEFLIGNTFPFVVFGSFGAFWLSWAATLQPSFNAYGAYSTTDNPADGINTIGFRASYAFVFIALGIMCLVYLICSIRTNMVFFMIFLTLLLTYCCLAGSFLQANNGNTVLAGRLQVTAGAFGFCSTIFGWWIFIAIMLASLDFPFSVPVGDLSGFIKGASEKGEKIV